MKRRIWLWELFGFAVTALVGTLLHFLYDWFGEAAWIAPFSSVNESTWEHMKLLFWPMLGYTVLESLFFREREDFWRIKLCGALIGQAAIPALFYTYNGVIGKSPDFVNIAIFFVSAAIAYFYQARMLYKENGSCISKGLAMLSFVLIAAAFVIFTFYPPDIAIFRAPL